MKSTLPQNRKPSFYHILKAEIILHHRGKAKPRYNHKKPSSYTAKKRDV
jgi:putative transposase